MTVDEGEGRLGELFMRLARRTHVLQVERLTPLGLTPAQARALSVLGRCDQPPRMAELAERLGVVPRAVTPIVDALEEAGLVRRRTDPNNRRSTLLELTDKGTAMRTQMYQARVGAAEDLFASLTAEQRQTLLALLEQADAATASHRH